MIDSQRLISNKREWNNCFIKSNQEILLDFADFALQEQLEDNLMVSVSRSWYNASYSMAAKPIKSLELDYTTIQCLIITSIVIKDWGVRSMISISGSLSFVMSSAPAKKNTKSAGDARYASQDPSVHSGNNESTLSHTISTPIRIRSAFFLGRTQLTIIPLTVVGYEMIDSQRGA